MKILIASAIVALGIASLSGCSATPAPDSSGSASPNTVSVDGKWMLVDGHDASGVFDTTEIDVPVEIEGDLITVGVCNHFGGDWKLEGSTVTIGEMVGTEMACTEPAGIMELESRILADFPKITTATIVDSNLHLTGLGFEMIFQQMG